MDVRPGKDGSGIAYLTTAGPWTYFTATNGRDGLELWKSDGSAAGTSLVIDLLPGPAGSLPNHLTRIGDRLYFSAVEGDRQQQPWRSDGTAAGTQRIGSTDAIGLPYPSQFTTFGDAVVFTARDAAGKERLWLLDAAGTVSRLGLAQP
jgi:ELWxxDGT repeat protein